MTDFNYPLWLNQAFREVLKKSLKTAADYESLEDNSLYITFNVQYKGVQLSKPMKQRFPEEIMIVIQNEYWNVVVEEDYFSVDLSFNGVLETVIVPYKAILSFSDPEFKIGYEFLDDKFLLDPEEDPDHYQDDEGDSKAYDDDAISKTLTDILAKKSPFDKSDKPKKKAKIVQINKK